MAPPIPRPFPSARWPVVCIDHDQTSTNPLLTGSYIEVGPPGALPKKYYDTCLPGAPHMIGEKVCNSKSLTGWMPTGQPCPPWHSCKIDVGGFAACTPDPLPFSCTDHNMPWDPTVNGGITFVVGDMTPLTIDNICLADAYVQTKTSPPALDPTQTAQFERTVIDWHCLDLNQDGEGDIPNFLPQLCAEGETCQQGACIPMPADPPPPPDPPPLDPCPGVSPTPCLDGAGLLVGAYGKSAACPTGDLLTPEEVTTTDNDKNGIYNDCEFPQRMSVGPNGEESDFDSFGGLQSNPGLSANGRIVVFDSAGMHWLPNLPPHKRQGYVHDRHLGTVALLSKNTDGVPGDGHSWLGAINDCGTSVVVNTSASNLLPNDAKGMDILLYDLANPLQPPVHVNAGHPQAFVAAMSGAGDMIGYTAQGDCYLRDLATPNADPELLNVNNEGIPFNGPCEEMAMSRNGRYIFMRAYGTNVDPLATAWGAPYGFSRDRQTGQTACLATNLDGTECRKATMFAVSDQLGAFSGASDDLVAGDFNQHDDVFLRAHVGGALTYVSSATAGATPPGPPYNGSYATSFSADSRYLTYDSDLLPESPEVRQVCVYAVPTGQTAIVSVNPDGQAGNGFSRNGQLSADGRFIVHASMASDLVEGDTNDVGDTFLTTNPLWTPPSCQ